MTVRAFDPTAAVETGQDPVSSVEERKAETHEEWNTWVRVHADSRGYLPSSMAEFHEAGGLPDGWQWVGMCRQSVSEVGNSGWHVVRTRSGMWGIVTDKAPTHGHRKAVVTNLWMSLGMMAEAMFEAGLLDLWPEPVAALLAQCPVAESENEQAEVMLAALGGGAPFIPLSAYDFRG